MIESLPRREREIFEILCSSGEATAAEVRVAMADAPSHSAVRTLLARLEGRIAISRLFERFPTLRSSGPAVRGGRIRFRGYASYPITW